QGDGDRGVVELHRACKVHLDATVMMIAEPEAESLPRRSRGLVIDADLVADEARGDAARTVIFDEMRPQATAVLAVDNGATGGARIALVGYDQFQRIPEQVDMLVIDRGDAGLARADQADRIVASADAGLEYDELAFVLLKIEARQYKKRPQRPERLHV